MSEVLIIEVWVFKDDRGFFMETYQESRYRDAGIDVAFVQDNMSTSIKGVLRGLHYQYPRAQAKLVQAIKGTIYDVAVDIRRGSPTFGQGIGVNLSEENGRQLFVPEGFAHGFCVLSDSASVLYKCSDFYEPKDEGGINWSDPSLAINWPVRKPLISSKDGGYPFLKDVPPDRLPQHRVKM